MLDALPWITLVFAFVAIPAALLIFRRQTSRWLLIAVVFYLANASFAAWYLAPWHFWSYWLYAAFLLVAVAGIIAALRTFRKGDWSRPGWRGLIGAVLLLSVGGYFLSLNLQSFSARSAPDDAIDLAFPFKGGQYAVIQGGAAPPLQMAHSANPSQIYALDIVKLNTGLTSSRRFLEENDFKLREIWDEPVYSPCAGEVVWKRDGIKDEREFDKEHPAGNVVGIACKDATVILAHFRQDTIAISEGDMVDEGSFLGRIGMSGRTFNPHLHMHVERGPLKRDFSDNQPVAFTLNGRFPYKGRIMSMRD